MFAAKAAGHRSIGFPSFAHGVVAGVEVLALFELVLQEVLFVGEFAVEAEELLFVFGEFLGGVSRVLFWGWGKGFLVGEGMRGVGARTLMSTLFFWCGLSAIFAVFEGGCRGWWVRVDVVVLASSSAQRVGFRAVPLSLLSLLLACVAVIAACNFLLAGPLADCVSAEVC